MYTILNPILLPTSVMTVITTGFSSIWGLEGFLPIRAIMLCIYYDFLILVGILSFKLLMGAINGKPEID